jgi:hypothetical protein
MFSVGDRVTHPSYPGEVGTVNRLVHLHGKTWYRVTWATRVGTNGLFPVDSELKKVGE